MLNRFLNCIRAIMMELVKRFSHIDDIKNTNTEATIMLLPIILSNIIHFYIIKLLQAGLSGILAKY
jgi:hypothetical protein